MSQAEHRSCERAEWRWLDRPFPWAAENGFRWNTLVFAIKDAGEDRVLADAGGGARPGADAAWAWPLAGRAFGMGCVPLDEPSAAGGGAEPRPCAAGAHSG